MGDAGPPVSFATVQSQVFTGCLGEGCHFCMFVLPDAGCPWDNDPLQLYGSAQMFVDTTVNRAAIYSPSKVRVKPFDPDHSFIVQKLEGTLGPSEGNRMPQNGNLIAPDKIQLLRDWISQGAQPN